MNRRLFLRGVAGAALSVPFLSSLQRPVKTQDVVAPKRLVIFYTLYGCLTNRWFPTILDGAINAAALSGTTLEVLTPHASKLLFPRGLALAPAAGFRGATVDGASWFDPHDIGMGSKLTCAPIDPQGAHYALSHSFDHEVARRVNQGTASPLVVSVGSFGASDVKNIASYSGSREPYAPERSPQNVYSALTGLFQGGKETEADYRVARGESIIDLVKGDLQTFRRFNMSRADHQRVDDWLQLLRETEDRVISVACNADVAAELGVTAAAVRQATPNFGATATAFTLGGDMMMRLMALTMICDSNRSLLLQWPGFVTFNFDGMSHTAPHHGLSHRNGGQMGEIGGLCAPNVLKHIHEIDLWYAKRYAQLVSLLDSIGEGDGTLLDNCACMWLPELADGNAHNNNNLPIVIAGSCGGYFKQGASVNLTGGPLASGNSENGCAKEGDPVPGVGGQGGTGSSGGNVPLNKLYVTLLNALGVKAEDGGPVTHFGVADTGSTFTTNGNGHVIDGVISNPGELGALKA